jgi:hypothetical protein
VRTRLVASLAFLVLPSLVGSSGEPREVRFPLTVDYELLTQLAAHELRGPGDEATILWRSDDGCSVFEIAAIRVGPADGQLEIQADGRGKAGLGVLSWCLFPVQRDADLRILARPALGTDWQLRLTDVQATVLDREGRSTFLMRRFSGVMGEPIEDAVARVRVDLTPPADDMRAVIRSSLGGPHAARALAALESLRPVGTAAAPDGVKAEIAMDVPPAPPETIGPEPPLSPEEQERWEQALGDWDAFLTFAVKELGLTDRDPEIVDRLFRLFVDGRHALLEVLTAGPAPGGDDPVGPLFLRSWTDLRRIVKDVARRRAAGRSEALLYLRFLAAGDALAALERVGPDVGIELSADGLRRLARTLDPDTGFDPRARGEAPDPQLRELFGFHEPPATPLPADPPPRGTPEPAAPEADAPPPNPAAPPGPGTPHTWWAPFVGVAHAAETDPAAELREIGLRLDRWVPEPQEMPEYRTRVSRLLDIVAATERKDARVPGTFTVLFRRLVRTTAWQESCWHQFQRRGGAVIPLASRTGDVGIMQVNRRVWRGVFDARLLERDAVYNADAGTQILAQYLVRYGQREARVTGGDVGRATYAAYNGGPGAYTRYRTGRRATPYTRRVDAAFAKKLRVTVAGRELDHVPCPPRVQ